MLRAHPPHPLHPDHRVVCQGHRHGGGAVAPRQGQGAVVGGDEGGVRAGRGVGGAVVGRGLKLDAAQPQPRGETSPR